MPPSHRLLHPRPSLSPPRQVEDIISTLQSLHLIKKWQGQHVVQVSQKAIDQYLTAADAKPGMRNLAKPECIRWAPRPPAAKPSKR